MQRKVIPWNKSTPPKEKELREALSQEGYSAFLWNDSSGANYPPHHHLILPSIVGYAVFPRV